MFDIGFWELVVVAVVALLVIGPERLPTVARTAGLWVGKARRFLSSVKADIEREIKAEELKRILDEQARSNPLEQIIEETKDSFRDAERSAGRDKPAADAPKPAARENADSRSDGEP